MRAPLHGQSSRYPLDCLWFVYRSLDIIGVPKNTSLLHGLALRREFYTKMQVAKNN
jgi:hypothetical protein